VKINRKEKQIGSPQLPTSLVPEGVLLAHGKLNRSQYIKCALNLSWETSFSASGNILICQDFSEAGLLPT
jgi:hypothetical protein